ncbi:response regulator, partial [Myxococcota bacterium]|nr:response regulator [Myxococcota bacterium]
GSGLLEFIHPDDQELVGEKIGAAFLSDAIASTGPFRVQHRDGSWRWVETNGASYRNAEGQRGYLSVMRNITDLVNSEEERRDLDRRVAQTQRLESLGVMAGGIAHDFNNLLTPILGEAGLCLMDLPEGSPVRSQVLKIEKAAKRAAALTNQMLAYAGEGRLDMKRVSLSFTTLEMVDLLESIVAGRARLDFDMDETVDSIEADPSQLSQVVMNLITNAAEAIENSEGCVTVRCGKTTVLPADTKRFLPDAMIEPGPCVFLEVEDDGCGMDEATRRRVFDPFFTTKFTGRGLGLAAVLGIVRGHCGAIEIDSVLGRGTRFRVLFPALDRDRREIEVVPPDSSIEAWRGVGTVLLVDDDPAVRELAQAVLVRAGLNVLLAGDGGAAIEIARKGAESIDAVVLDWTMPGIGGEETLEKILEFRPGVPVILVSGYSRHRPPIRSNSYRLAGFLEKPFLPTDLLRVVRSALVPELSGLDAPSGAS